MYRNIWKRDLCDNLFCLEPGPYFFRKIFSNLVRMHKIRIDFGKDTGILVNKSCLKFDLQDFCALIISHGAQNPGFNGLSFQPYHHTLTSVLNG